MDDLFEHQHDIEGQSAQDKAINGFYTHFMIFLAVITALAIVNLTSSNIFWVQWVLLGWGAGIGLHAYLVFVRNPRREAQIRALRAARKRPSPAPTSPPPGEQAAAPLEPPPQSAGTSG
jgi:hypothetical protein